MSLRPRDLPRDPDLLIAMVLERDAEIERLKTSLKTLNALIHGPRSERGGVVLASQGVLDLGDLETGATPAPANDVQGAAAPASRPPRRKASCNIGHLPKHLPRVEEVIEPASTECPCCIGSGRTCSRRWTACRLIPNPAD